MVPERLEFYGLRSYKERTVILFPKDVGLTYILSRNYDAEKMDGNAGGKSTIQDAISIALYGSTPSKLLKDSYINDDSDQYFVQLRLTGGILVERWKKRGRPEGLRYQLPGQEWVEKSLAETQQSLIDDVCGVSFEVFCNTIYLTQHSQVVKFLEATPLKRAPVLAEMENHAVWARAGALADKEAKEIRKTKGMLEVENQRDEATRRRLRQELETVQAEFHRRQNEDRAGRAERAAKIISVRETIAKHREFLRTPPRQNRTELDRRITETQKRITALTERQVEHQHTARIAHLRPGIPCPTCKREMTEVDTHELDDQRARAQAKVVEVSSYLESEKTELRSLNEQVLALQQSENHRASLQKEINMLQEQIMAMEDMDSPTNFQYFVEKERKLKEELKEVEAKYTKNAMAEIDLTAKEERLMKWKRAFTREIRDLLFDKVRVGLAHHANNILRPLFGARYHIECPPCEKDQFVINVMRDGKEREYLAYSGGEKYRFQMGLFLAFGRIMDSAQRCPFRFRLLDEFGEGLDAAGRVAIQELLFDIVDSGEVSYFLVTAPVPDMAEGHHQINVVMENKESRIV